MIDVHDSDAETVEKLKKWWDDNGRTTVFGLVIGLGGVFGWSGYNSYQEQNAEAASLLYQQIVTSAEQDQFEEVRKHGQVLMTEFPDSGYAALTALYLSKAALADDRADEAKAHLTWVKDNASLPELQLVATTRLARLALDVDQLDEAQAQIDGAEPGKFKNMFAIVRGDLLLEQGKPAEARKAYEQAMEELSIGDGEYQRLQLKLDDLGTLNVPADAS